MISHVRILLFLLLLVVVGPARGAAQGTWHGDGFIPDLSYPAFCYDPVRDRMVMFAGGPTVEYDPVGRWWTGQSATSPSPIDRYPNCGLAYDYGRHRVVFHGARTTWTWDGTTWSSTLTSLGCEHLLAHQGRGTVMLFGGNGSQSGNELYEWNGTAWTWLPTTNRPPRPPMPQGWHLAYISSAYDARRDKIVLFGSAEFFSEGGYANAAPTLWEWDASQGWVNRSVAFPITFDPFANAYFDAHRGTVIALVYSYATGLRRTFEWDGGSSWQELIGVGGAPPMSLESLFQGYDALRDQYYTMFVDNNEHFGYIYENTHPARFEPQGAGCPGSLGQTELHLLHPWTRAWLGRTLVTELANLPQSVGIIITGLSDQQSGPTTLPKPLDGFGMPGCFARVSPDASKIICGSGNRVTLGLSVPVSASLLGAVVFQQGCSLDPGFNALGMTVSNSVRITIGHL